MPDPPEARLRRLPLLQGLLPVARSQIPVDVLAGVTLAALSIPEVLGYAKIAGMPVVTGLYTLLLPMAVYAVLGSSRHLVVGADSATAAILSASLAGLAVMGSARYVQLAGLVALLAGGLLLLARLARLAFLANFLSRTVLVGFLTGVGFQVAAGQLPDILGVRSASGNTVSRLLSTVGAIPHAHRETLALSLAVMLVVVAARRVTRRAPGALIAVISAIIVSRAADLAGRGVAVLGAVPSGLPHLGLPALSWPDATALLGTAASMFVVILAQSAATSGAYAVKYEEPFSEETDLVGLGAANIAAAFCGTFVVNGSPTKTQVVDSAGGRSQLASLATAAVVLSVLVALTGPLAALPIAALAAVVFLIAVELIDVRGMRRILAVRRHEFAVALVTATAVVVLGVEPGIVVAVVASIIDHLRHSYHPRNSVLVKSAAGHWQPSPSCAARGPRKGWWSTGSAPASTTPTPPALSTTSLPSPDREPPSGGSSWTARPSATSTTRRPRSSPGSSTNSANGTSTSSSAASSPPYTSSSPATASPLPSTPTPITTLPVRHSRHSGPPATLRGPVPGSQRTGRPTSGTNRARESRR